MLISPSMLSADFAYLGQDLKKVEDAGADLLHIDVMDGQFVPNISFGMPVIAAIRPFLSLPFDVHLMISDPLKYIDDFVKAGADMISFHVEIQGDPTAVIQRIKSHGKKAGMVVNPATPAEELFPYIKDLDLALVMTVVPGFGGQKFMSECVGKLSQLKKQAAQAGNPDIILQVDGGITADNIQTAAQAGANCFVAGSAIFNKPDYQVAIQALRKAALGA